MIDFIDLAIGSLLGSQICAGKGILVKNYNKLDKSALESFFL